MPYTAPIADLRFALEACADLWRLKADNAFPDLDADLLGAILEQAGALAGETLAPLNATGDREGVRLENGVVRSAGGFAAAYAAFVEGGWQGLAVDAAHGGQGMPTAVEIAVHEMMQGANMAFSLCPMLTHAAIEALIHHGTPALQDIYLPKLTTGEWTGTMLLTEPHAGSDVGALSSRAEPAADGTYRVTGQKIFITWGEHDMAENIVHLILARLPDSPAGAKGVSLFLVPKFIPDAGGKPGQRNGVRCIGLERKMGIHASPTCTMAFEDATGWLLGEAHDGMRAMFTMMNLARLHVGVEGVGLAEAAYQKALAYAQERRQGRAEGAKGAAPIILHPDVRRMLMEMKARTLAARAICAATAVAGDLARTTQRDDVRAAAKAREDLLTPVAKAWSTDAGIAVASLGVQIHGGMGFVEEGGAAQFYRDVRIAAIYEGTNGIQAMDLAGRKLAGDGGAAMRALIAEAREITAQARAGDLGAVADRLRAAIDALETATTWMLAPHEDRRNPLAGATPYLALAGDVAGGMLLAKGVLAQPDGGYRAVLGFYAETILAAAPGRLPSVTLGADALYDQALAEFALA